MPLPSHKTLSCSSITFLICVFPFPQLTHNPATTLSTIHKTQPSSEFLEDEQDSSIFLAGIRHGPPKETLHVWATE